MLETNDKESLGKDIEDPKKSRMTIVELKNTIAEINSKVRGRRKQSVNMKIETEVMQRKKKNGLKRMNRRFTKDDIHR